MHSAYLPHVVFHHDSDQFFERCLAWVPSELGLGFRRVTEELVDFSRAEVFRVDFDEGLACLHVDTFFVGAFPFPAEFDAYFLKCQCAEVAHGVVLTGGDDEVVRFGLLEDEPHALDVVFGISPVAERVKVAQIELVLEPLCYSCHCQGDFSCHEVLAAAFRLVVEQYAVAAVHAVALAVVFHYPEAVLFGDAVWRARIERCRLLLRHLLHLAVELRCRSLINAAFVGKTRYPHGFQQSQGAHGIHVGGELRHVEAHLHMALSREVINLVGSYLRDDAYQRRAVGHVAPMQVYQTFLVHVAHPFVEVQMFDAAGVEARAAAQHSVHLIAFFNKELRQKRAVLTGDSGN